MVRGNRQASIAKLRQTCRHTELRVDRNSLIPESIRVHVYLTRHFTSRFTPFVMTRSHKSRWRSPFTLADVVLMNTNSSGFAS